MTAIVSPSGSVVYADEPERVVDEVWEGMWVGGSFAPYPAWVRVDVAVLACPRGEVHWPGAPAAEHIDVPLRDGPLSDAEIAEVHIIADRLATRVRTRDRVAFRCYLGLNRSALVAGITRHILTGDPGRQIVADLRAVRGPDALSNPKFAAHLEALT